MERTIFTWNSKWVNHALKVDIITETGTLLLRRGMILSQEQLNQLSAMGILIQREDVITAAEIMRQTVSEATDQLGRYFQDVRRKKPLPIQELQKQISPRIVELSQHPDLIELFGELQALDNYTYKHNIAVGVISTLLGKWMGLSQEELDILTLGAILHDIGKMRIPMDILNKPGKLTRDEYEDMKKHTTYGYEILCATEGLSPRTALIALQHHERENGQGYPQQLQPEEVDPLSKIVAVADVFHAMTSKRVYHEASPFFQVMKEIHGDVYGRLDAHITFTFLQQWMLHTIGKKALLSNGEIGTILMVPASNPLQPLIQLDQDQYIDLQKHSHIELIDIKH